MQLYISLVAIPSCVHRLPSCGNVWTSRRMFQNIHPTHDEQSLLCRDWVCPWYPLPKRPIGYECLHYCITNESRSSWVLHYPTTRYSSHTIHLTRILDVQWNSKECVQNQ